MAKKVPDRAAFDNAQRVLLAALKALRDVSPEAADNAERMSEEVRAWSPRYFSDDMIEARRNARATGTVMPSPAKEPVLPR